MQSPQKREHPRSRFRMVTRRSTASFGPFDIYPQLVAGQSNASYYDYLLGLHALEEGVGVPVQEKIAELIDAEHIQTKTLDSTLQEQSELLSTHLSEQTEQLQTVNINLKAMQGAIQHQTSIVDWRLGQVVERLEGLTDSLEVLIELAKSPSQVWAYEQFDIAREAYRRRLYDDALTSVDRAIGGYGSQTGYNLDYRFYALKGHIRMGSIENTSPHIVNPEAAEECFIKAAEYAASVSSLATSECLCFAAVAALGCGDENRASEHIERALKFYEHNAEAKFLQAKLNFRNGDIDAGGPQLIVAMSIDKGYVLKALMDGDIENDIKARDRAILVFHNMRREHILKKVTPFVTCINNFRDACQQLPPAARDVISSSLELSGKFSQFGKQELSRIENAGIFSLDTVDQASYELYDEALTQSQSAVRHTLAKTQSGYVKNNAGTYTFWAFCIGAYILGFLSGSGWFWSLFYLIPAGIVGFIASFAADYIVSGQKQGALKKAALEAKKVVDDFVRQDGEIDGSI